MSLKLDSIIAITWSLITLKPNWNGCIYTLLFPITILSVYNYYKKGNVNIYIGTILVLSMIIGGYLGSKLILLLNKDSGDTISRRIGGIISIMCGIILLTK